jgi:hypothetical protein
MLKRIAIALLAVLVVIVAAAGVFAPPVAVRAQQNLKYGDSVIGELTAQQGEVTYVFEGQEGDLVVVQAIQIVDANNNSPELKVTLSDPNGNVLIDQDASYAKILVGMYSRAFFEVLPTSGDYTITVTRTVDDKNGQFELQLFQPEPLQFDQDLSIVAKVRGFSRFLGVYTLPADKPFRITFTELEGSQGISASIKEYSNNFLREVASGVSIQASDITFTMRPGGAEFYFVTLGSPSYLFGEATLKYTITPTLVE